MTAPRSGPEPYRPERVFQLELAGPGEPLLPNGATAEPPFGPAAVLGRLHGHPLGLAHIAAWEAGDAVALRRAVERSLRAEIERHRTADAHAAGTADAEPPCLAARASVLRDPPPISVVICTHDRPGMLRDCLDSVVAADYPRFEVLVVDNAPHTEEAAELVRERYAGRIRYLREPVAGLSRARNRGVAAADGRIIAISDDDTLIDRQWLAAVAETFAGPDAPGCVTGLIAPAELATSAQAAVARHGDFGKGFAVRHWSLDRPTGDPLFPFTTGRCGSGANLAVDAGLLRGLGGFDTATGVGTAARGGEDLLLFFRVLTSGQTLTYQPSALVWHRSRRDMGALRDQAFGYGAGLGAYLSAVVMRDPRSAPSLLRRLPRGIGFAVNRARSRPGQQADWSWGLSAAELVGMLYGPLGFARALGRARAVSAATPAPSPLSSGRTGWRPAAGSEARPPG